MLNRIYARRIIGEQKTANRKTDLSSTFSTTIEQILIIAFEWKVLMGK